jgi:hypothetical protein
LNVLANKEEVHKQKIKYLDCFINLNFKFFVFFFQVI